MSDTQEEKYKKLKAIVETYLPDDVSVDAITLESNFTSELNINSANLVDIVLDVEDTFDIMLENDDMDGMLTVKDALQIIDKKMAEK
ncbi:acyl carrier protein [Croceitalea marina]|uniref:Acyl carrier protein n=1 Tax=Croceitalea marina TaxID=1775166 RepID=A0ABW5MRI3_9FLAO